MAYCDAELKIAEEYRKRPAFKTSYCEMDNALNGGISSKSIVLLTGETGIGKSTLALNIIMNLWITYQKEMYIYSGELEEGAIIDSMYKQLNVTIPKLPNIHISTNGDINDIDNDLNKIKPKFILIDNLMCLACGKGDTNQLQNNAINKCREWVNKYDAILILVAHANKNSNSKTDNGSLTINSICGSSNVPNQASLVLALNTTNDQNIRVLEVLKNRKTGKRCKIILTYDNDHNVYKQIRGMI